MPKFELNIPELLNHLHRHEVDFIIVGGVCAALHGAPVTTFDLDVVHSRSPKNLHHLEAALQLCDAHYRNHPKKIRPDAELLSSKGHHLLMTKFGPLDLLGTIEKGLDYEDLADHATPIRLDDGIFYLLDLEFFIRIKSDSPFEKDRMKMAILKRTLEEKNIGNR